MAAINRSARPYPQTPRWWISSAVLATLLGLAGSSGAPAVTSALPPGSLQPTAQQRLTARRVADLLEREHFRRVTIDDRLSAQIYDRYLDALDGQRLYLLSSDIAQFNRHRLRFDDMIRNGEIDAAFEMFARFKQRSRERLTQAQALLAKEPDFALNEYFEFDREKAPWAANAAELNEIWRKRVKNDLLSLQLAGKNFSEASELLRKRYERAQKRIDQISADDVFESLMNACARSFDPHSSYFSPRNSEEYKIQMSLNYEGIGASLQLVDDMIQVMNIIEGGPAAVDGVLKPNDRIVGVGQSRDGAVTDVVGWRVDDVVQLIRGKGGTPVRLQVLPGGAAPGSAEKTVLLTRGKVSLEAQAAHQEIKVIKRGERNYRVGIITVPGFYTDVEAQRSGDANFRSTTRDVARLLAELRREKVDGLVVDLRGNGGGYLPEAQSLIGLFIDRGPVVQLRYSSGDTEVLDDPDSGSTVYDGPLAVLVDRFSASASEIFAGAIQDYRRGIVLGQRTFGKGTVQNLFPLDRWSSRNPSGQITVTIGKFYRVTGESTQHRGVEPDVVLASPIDDEEIGESALEAALPWDRIAGVPFGGNVRNPSSLAPLAAAETQRAQRDPNYRWLVADIAAVDEIRKQNRVSLNLKARRDERERIDRERLARENQRRAATGLTALKSIDELDASTAPDVVLEQASEVLADLVESPAPNAMPAQVPRASAPSPHKGS